jgi:hypothetical protein
MGEVLAVLATTGAAEVDAVCAADSDVAIYARAASRRAYLLTLAELGARVGSVRGEDDPFERIARELEATTSAANDGWDAAEKALAEDSACWPEVSGAPSPR